MEASRDLYHHNPFARGTEAERGPSEAPASAVMRSPRAAAPALLFGPVQQQAATQPAGVLKSVFPNSYFLESGIM